MIYRKNEKNGRPEVRVLVVDDHPLIRDALRQVLKELDGNIELLEADSAGAAMAIAAERDHVDLILLDLELTGTPALGLLRDLREQSPAVPVVVISALDDADIIMRTLDIGAMGYIPKTSPPQVLIAALHLVLSGGVYLPPAVLRHASTHESNAQTTTTTLRDHGLTQRQSEVLALLVQGKPNKLICRELNMAEGTVKIHITAIFKALRVANRTQAVIAVSKLGLKP